MSDDDDLDLFAAAEERLAAEKAAEAKLAAAPDFDGETYEPALDKKRLTSNLERIFAFVKDGEWHTPSEIAHACNLPDASAITARLRDFRKPKFGGHTLIKRRVAGAGLYEYRLILRVPEGSTT